MAVFFSFNMANCINEFSYTETMLHGKISFVSEVVSFIHCGTGFPDTMLKNFSSEFVNEIGL